MNNTTIAFVVLTLAIPFGLVATGWADPEWAAQTLARSLGMFVFWGGIAHLVTRKKPVAIRAMWRIVVAELVFALVATGSVRSAISHREHRTFARLMLEHDRSYIPAINDINERFANFNPMEGLSLDSLTTDDGIEAGRVNADRYVRLLDKRRDVVVGHMDEVRRIADVSTSGASHDELRAAIDANNAQSMKVFAELDAAQRAHAAAIDAVFVLAEQNRGKMFIRDGSLVFATPALEAEYTARAETVARVEARMEAAQGEAEKMNDAAAKARAAALPGVRKTAGEQAVIR